MLFLCLFKDVYIFFFLCLFWFSFSLALVTPPLWGEMTLVYVCMYVPHTFHKYQYLSLSALHSTVIKFKGCDREIMGHRTII